jgi:myo-inositol 2-dehydrogenase/D-chiro-inositol 1-dehydrogenase
MLLPLRNIWDTKIQCICGVIAASDGEEIEAFLSGNFGQASLDPARIVINPNRLYPIEAIICREGRFSISVLRAGQRDVALRLSAIRRRALSKSAIIGLNFSRDERYEIPYLKDCLRTVFAQVEHTLDTGDHTLMICKVLESRVNSVHIGERPLFYPEISGNPSRFPRVTTGLRRVYAGSGAKDIVVKTMQRRRTPELPNVAVNTYREGGQTAAEVDQILSHGIQDRGRILVPPGKPPALLRRKVPVCVVGTGAWGVVHCELLRKASPLVELYVCGQNPDRLARVARAVGARDYVVGLENAVNDARFPALSLVLPHDVHAKAVQMAAGAGKHVLVEKPIATTLEDADEMIESARRAGTILMVAEDMHFRPSIREALLAIDRGDIGEPIYLQVHAGGVMRPEGWKADKKRAGGGVLMDLGVHYVRAMRLLMGEPDQVLASRAMQVNTKISGEDSVQLMFWSRYGWQVHMLLSWISPRGHCPDIVIAGEKGTIHLWPGAAHFDLYPAAPRTLTRLLSYVRPTWMREKLMKPQLQRIRRSVPGGKDGYAGELREFLSAVAEERKPVSKPEDARRDLQIVLTAYDALQNGRWTELGSWVSGMPRDPTPA